MTAAALGTGNEGTDLSTACYLYALAAGEPPFVRVSGIAEAPVETLAVGRITAVLSHIQSSDIDVRIDAPDDIGEGGKVARLARAHDHVVHQIFEHGPVLPLRFGTVFRDADQISDWIAQREGELVNSLRDIGSCAEWKVRVVVAPRAAESPPAPSGGASYLAARSADHRARQHERSAARQLADEVSQGLAALARATAPLGNLTSAATSPTAGLMCLVAPEAQRDFLAFAAKQAPLLKAAGFELDLSGPWPPYHFVSLEAAPDE